MKIAILNESFLTLEQLERLRKIAEVEIHPETTTEEEAIERLRGADISIADMYVAPLNKKVIDSTTQLQLLAINSTGYDLVDTVAAAAKAIKVANAPGFSTDAVAEHALALMMSLIRKIKQGDEAMRQAPFQVDPANQDHKKFMGYNLVGKTLGIIGLGAIGRRMAEIGVGLGMRVIAYTRTPKNVPEVYEMTFEEVLKQSDVLSLHLPMAEGLANLISAKELALMKPTAILINTARGPLVNSADLAEALKSGKLAGAGLDVIEPWSEDNPLLKLENVVFTPHSAFFTTEALENLGEIITQNVESFIQGSPINIVNE